MPRRRHIERDAEISRAIAAGRSVRSIAAEHGLAVSSVYSITRREGWTFHYGSMQLPRFCAHDGCSRPLPSARNRFCSFDCFVASLRSALPTCPQCGGKTRRKSSKFCSRLCYHRWLRDRWGEIHEARNRRILMEAASGRPLARIANDHGVSHKTVTKVVNANNGPAPGTCAAPGCSAPLPRRYHRFCSLPCYRGWQRAQQPWCANGCGARAKRRSGMFCGPSCQAAYIRQRNLVRNTWIFLAAALGTPRAEIARRTGLHQGYVSRIVSSQRRPLLPAPHHAPCRPKTKIR